MCLRYQLSYDCDVLKSFQLDLSQDRCKSFQIVQIVHTPVRLLVQRRRLFSAADTSLTSLTLLSKKFYLHPICEIYMSYCCIRIAVDMITVFVAPSASWKCAMFIPSFIPKDNYQSRRICSNEFLLLMTHYPLLFVKKKLGPFHWHPPLFLSQSNHSIPSIFSVLSVSRPFPPIYFAWQTSLSSGSESIYFYLFSDLQHTWLSDHISGQSITIHCTTVCLLLMACSIIDQSLLRSWPQIEHHPHHCNNKIMTYF